MIKKKNILLTYRVNYKNAKKYLRIKQREFKKRE